MKKNLISVLILALCFVNLVLSAIIVFTLVPQNKKANELITAVCNAVDLELQSGAATGITNTSIDKIKVYNVNSGEKMTCSFANDENGGKHYIVATVSLSMNMDSADYEKYSDAGPTDKDPIIRTTITDIIHNYTMDEFEENREAVYQAILVQLQNMFAKDYVVSVNFSDVMLQ